MTTNLSKELQKYYIRKGNRIIFKNGMTLNQLALEMWERLGNREIDASVISKVLNSERSFTFKQLVIFEQILRLKKINKDGLREVWMSDLFRRSNIPAKIWDYKQKYLFEYLNILVKNANIARKRGLPESVLDWAVNAIYLAESEQNNNNSQELRRIIREALDEILRIYIVSGEPGKVAPTVSGYIKKFRNNAILSKNKDWLSASYSFDSSMKYAMGDYKQAIKNALISVNLTDSNTLRVYGLRMFAISSALSGVESDFLSSKKLLDKYEQEVDLGTQCMIHFGHAKALASLNQFKKSEEYLTKAIYDLENLEKNGEGQENLRKIQISKTALYLANKSKSKSYKKDALLMGEQGRILADTLGYLRYKNEIEELMDPLS